MHNRRGLARLLVLVLAGLAVAGTSPAQPSPGPTQKLDLSGSLRVTAEEPVAIVPFDLVVGAGDLDSVVFAPSLANPPTEGLILSSVEIAGDAATRRSDSLVSGATQPPTSSWSFSCRSNPCGAKYALVVAWVDAPAGGSADVTWRVDATATYRGASGTAATPGQVTLTAGSDDGFSPGLASETITSGRAVRLIESDRIRMWTVDLHRTSRRLAAGEWAPVAQARLSASVNQVEGPPFEAGPAADRKDRRLANLSDPPVQLRVIAANGLPRTLWASDRALLFDPFAGCSDPEACTVSLTIGLAWADGRPETEFEASWALDIASIAVIGKAEPIDVTITSIEPLHVATATTSGSFDLGGAPRGQLDVPFTAVAPRLIDRQSPWRELQIPSRAVARVRVTSVGPTPLPDDATIWLCGSGSYGIATSVEARLGEEAVFAFEPLAACSDGVTGACTATGSISAAFGNPNRNKFQDGMIARIEWWLEVGVGTVDEGSATVRADPTPTPRP